MVSSMRDAAPVAARRVCRAVVVAGVCVGLLGGGAGLSLAWGALDPAPVAGAMTSGDSLIPWSGNGGYDVSDYDIALTYTPPVGAAAGRINATATIAARTLMPLSSFSLDLYGLTVTSVQVNGAAAAFSRLDDPANHRHKLVITPATAISGEFTATITYGGEPQDYYFNGDSSFHVGWIPTAPSVQGGQADGGAVGIGQPVSVLLVPRQRHTNGSGVLYDPPHGSQSF